MFDFSPFSSPFKEVNELIFSPEALELVATDIVAGIDFVPVDQDFLALGRVHGYGQRFNLYRYSITHRYFSKILNYFILLRILFLFYSSDQRFKVHNQIQFLKRFNILFSHINLGVLGFWGS